MKKIVSIVLAAAMLLSLAACQSTDSTDSTTTAAPASTETHAKTPEATAPESEAADVPETITITALNAAKEAVSVEVPYNPQRIAILDMACLDILDNLGLGDRVVGSASTSLDYLQSYMNNDSIENLGTIKEADLEAVMACEPDIIFIGGRLSSSYDALREIAPVVFLTTDSQKGVVESTRNIATTIASIFGLDDEIAAKMVDFDARIAALAAFAEGKNALIGMCTSGSFNVLDNSGRCALIGREIGFHNLSAAETADSNENSGHGEGSGRGEGNEHSEGSGRGEGGGTATHGNEASFELIAAMNPDYIFVMDRDAAIGTSGAQLAQEIMENELVMSTDTYKNGNIVYLAHPAVWYTAEGGITALDYMLADLESALLQ